MKHLFKYSTRVSLLLWPFLYLIRTHACLECMALAWRAWPGVYELLYCYCLACQATFLVQVTPLRIFRNGKHEFAAHDPWRLAATSRRGERRFILVTTTKSWQPELEAWTFLNSRVSPNSRSYKCREGSSAYAGNSVRHSRVKAEFTRLQITPFQFPLLENGLEASVFNVKYVDERWKMNDIKPLLHHRARISTSMFGTIVESMDVNIAHFCRFLALVCNLPVWSKISIPNINVVVVRFSIVL